MPCVADKGSVASVTRSRRPRAGSSHGMSLINARSSFPLSEPSLKELHTSRAPLGLNKDMPTGCEAVLMKLCHWDLHKKFSPNDILTPDGQMQTDLKHMNTCELKLSELTGNCFTYNNLAARSSACWCKYWQNHKQELSLQTGMTWLGQQTKLDKPIPLRGTLDVFNTLTGHASCMT